ncbi:portal protein [Stenotrophomonas indicatrix]|uniref:portal protein n=1 Tax=Stenotrophomonas indicatrix TaxID=2045451 RepID=UPI0008D5E20F|nr:portal protein [Stenotrophomonas indicatrix]SET91426.1 Phage P22-like portal protein [Stenotrophomonas indicatrix]SEU12672.1 Phage P22-like portal protein [Stenotrophomonas indicatrix]
MAEYKNTPEDPKFATERSGVNKEDLHKEMLTRHQYARDYWRDQYRLAEEDMEFAFMPDTQWDEWMAQSRVGRPMYTVNKLRQAMKQITNDQRQNRPQAKVRAVEDSDADLAEIRQGLIRNIDQTSEADRARDTAFQFAVGGGYGVWRVNYSYEDDGGFDMVIRKEEISNPYTVVFDPAAKAKDRRDARFAFVDSSWARSAFREKWPDATLVSVDDCSETNKKWFQEEDVTVSEYWYKTSETYTLVLMSNGASYDEAEIADVMDEMAQAGITVQRSRKATREKVWQCIVSGAEILEGPNEWAGRFIPLVPVWGEILNLGGKETFFGAVRFGKDAQRMYNYERSTFIEVLSDQPYSPFMAPAESLAGYEGQWNSLKTKRPPVLLYKSNPELPNAGKPSREPTAQFPAALAQAAAISSDDIKAATGIYDASLGARSNETSGRAILARQREGDVANFDYIDNLSYAMKYDFEITNDLITKIYDTERQIRIIGEDGAEKVIRVNQAVLDQQTGREVTLNDLSQGRYDIAVTVGPSYTTQRMEAAEAMMQLANDPSPLGMVAKYGFIKSLDMPGLEDVRKAARRIVVQAGLLEPEEGEEAPQQQQQPSPEQMAQAQKMQADAKKSEAQSVSYMASAQKDAAQAESIQLDNLTKEQQAQLLALQRTFLTEAIAQQGAPLGAFSFQ